MKNIKFLFGAVAISASLGAALTGGNVSAISGTTSGGCAWEFDTIATVPSFTIGPATSGGTCQLTDTDDNFWGSLPGSMQYDHGVYIKTFTIQPGVKAPANMNSFFSGLGSVESLDVNNLDVSAATDMVGVFVDVGKGGAGVNELDLSKWDTSNVTDMMNMFAENKIKKLVLSNSFDTRKVTGFTQMFYNSVFEELTLNFDTTSATEMSWMFNNAKELKTLDISSFSMNRPSPINIIKMFDRMGANVAGGTEIKINESFTRASDAEWAEYNFPQASYDVLDASGLLGSSVATADINAMLGAMAPGTTVTLALAGSVTPSGPVGPVNPVTPSAPGAPNTGEFSEGASVSGVTMVGSIATGVLMALMMVPMVVKRVLERTKRD